ncbi:hypothetical protein K2Y11_06115 [bacterium]|nr:hypothetical protein [bacterium]
MAFTLKGVTSTYRNLLVIVLLGALAFVSRWTAIHLLHAPDSLPVSAYEHGSIARNLVEGRGFVFEFYGPPGVPVPTSHQAPLVSYVLAAGYVLFGTETPASFWFVLLLQAMVASFSVIALTQAVRLASGKAMVGYVAGLLLAVYPPLVVSVCHVQAVTWNLAALSFLLWGWFEIRQGSNRLGIPLFVGGSLVAWHADPILGGVSFLMLLALLLPPKPSLRSSVLAAVLIAVGLTPWITRNYLVHGRFVAMKDSFWYVFWQGNTAASHGTDKLAISREDRREVRGISVTKSVEQAQHVREKAVSVDSTLPEHARLDLLGMPREIDRMNVFRSLILAELSARPMQYVEKCLLRLRQWLWFDETNPRSYVFAYRASYLSLATVAAIGLFIERRRWKNWLPLFVASGGLTLLHVLVITSARFRLPIELLLIPFAGVAVASVLGFLFQRNVKPIIHPEKIQQKRAA